MRTDAVLLHGIFDCNVSWHVRPKATMSFNRSNHKFTDLCRSPDTLQIVLHLAENKPSFSNISINFHHT
jgi:hypothetical protein